MAAAAAAKAAAAAVSAGAAFVLSSERAHADGGGSTFRFPSFYSFASSSVPATVASPPQQSNVPDEALKVSNQLPRITSIEGD